MNWKYKALLQRLLAIIPFGEKVNFQLQKFSGGNKLSHVDEYVNSGVRIVKLLIENGFVDIKNKQILEVGTGWLPTFPILFSLLGAGKIYTYDHVPHLRFTMTKSTLTQIKKSFPFISKQLGITVEKLEDKCSKAMNTEDLTRLFEFLNVQYRAPEDATYTKIPDNSLDLFFSYAVLEHVPENIVIGLTQEALRTLKQGAFYYNYIGLHDHYVSFDKKITKVNFLKYPEWLWKILAKNKITYLNRLRNSQFVKIIEDCGFEIVSINTFVDSKSLKAIRKMKIDKKFSDFELEDLATTCSEILARKTIV
ncbi:MAG: hypothetical protein JETT_2784 [Candidatus Jettenia ecosi]|uniref:Uncharacterized protein n=1 Tax=Candidatus Jettenia ecosi TaxID=2494326 RepID=A0A533Q9L7_9BACT|nr:MAG: hypothetical protein JETT_2784 [Candidatus Jettenia ecosi]